MSALPKSPQSITKNAETAVRLIDDIDKATDRCVTDDRNVSALLNLYRTSIRVGTRFSSLAADGYTSSVLGPKIAEIIGLTEAWEEYEPTYVVLKSTHIPAFVMWVVTNKAAILATATLDAEGFVVYNPLPEALQSEVAPLLANIAASYA